MALSLNSFLVAIKSALASRFNSCRHKWIVFVGVGEASFAERISGSVSNKTTDGHPAFASVHSKAHRFALRQIWEVGKPQRHLKSPLHGGLDKPKIE